MAIASKKIVFVGDVAVGKTSIIQRLVNETFENDYSASIGADFLHKTINVNESFVKLVLWDTAGQEKYKSLIPSYIRKSSLIFLVFDVTERKTFDNLNKWIKFIQKIHQCHIVILGNKVDLQENRVVNYEEASKFAKENEASYYEVSAKTGSNVDYSFYSCIINLPIFEDVFGIEELGNPQKLIEKIKNDSKMMMKTEVTNNNIDNNDNDANESNTVLKKRDFSLNNAQEDHKNNLKEVEKKEINENIENDKENSQARSSDDKNNSNANNNYYNGINKNINIGDKSVTPVKKKKCC